MNLWLVYDQDPYDIRDPGALIGICLTKADAELLAEKMRADHGTPEFDHCTQIFEFPANQEITDWPLE